MGVLVTSMPCYFEKWAILVTNCVKNISFEEVCQSVAAFKARNGIPNLELVLLYFYSLSKLRYIL